MQDGTYLVKADGSIVNYGERWSYGYFVADGSRGVEASTRSASAIHKVARNLARNASADGLVGVWTDPDTGIVYIDPVDHVDSREYAIALGTQRGELAIWDARDNVAITL